MNSRKIITFYSYKGGVGRTFALANVGVLLARWGHRVLCMDWDLEAPGLSDYFQPSLSMPIESGLIDWIEAAGADSDAWQEHVIPVRVPWEGKNSGGDKEVVLDFIPVGKQDDSYIRRIQDLDWASLYREKKLGSRLERLREELLLAYDFVLIDSRTGISDSGGICTIQLPDVIVFLFTASKQSLEGVTDAVRRAKVAQKNLPHDRAPLLTLPVLSRFDGKEEHKRGQEWLGRIANDLPEFYTQWVDAPPISELEESIDPKSLVDSARLLSLCTLPYVPYWSFGEELAVTSENTAFSQNVSHHLETISAILAHRLTKSSLLLESRQKYVDSARLPDPTATDYKFECFITSDFRNAKNAAAVAAHLQAQGIPVWHESLHLQKNEPIATRLQSALENSRHFVVLAGPAAGSDRTLDQLTKQIARELVDHPGDRFLLGVAKESSPVLLPPVMRDRRTVIVGTFEPKTCMAALVKSLELKQRKELPPRCLDKVDDPEDKDFARQQKLCGAELAGLLGSLNFRHGAPILAVACAWDGRAAVTGGADGVLRLWDLETGREIRSFQGHQGSVMACALSADGQRVLSGSDDKTLKLWDAGSGKELRSFQGHQGSVRACALSGDGQRVLSGSADNTLKLWDAGSGKEIRSFQGHQGSVMACALSADGQRVLSGSDDKTLKLWDAGSGKEIRSFQGHQGSVNACALSADGQRVLSGSYDTRLKLWDASSGKEIRSFQGHQGTVRTCALSADGQRVLSGSDDKTLKLWDAGSGKELRSFQGHQGSVRACALSGDGQRVLSGSSDKTLKLWDAGSGKELRSFQGHQGTVRTCALSADGQRVLSGSADKTLKLWDAGSGKELRSFQGHQGSVRACALSGDGQRVLSGSADKTLKLWDAGSGKEMRSFQGHHGSVMACALSADGQRVLSGSYDNTLKLWDAGSGEEIRSFQGHQASVMACALSGDGRRVLSGSYDQTLKLWDAGSGKEICSWNLPHPAQCVAWTHVPPTLWPERNHAGPVLATAVGLTNGTVLLFDLTGI